MNFFLPMLFDIAINNWYQCLCLILFCSTKIASLLVDRCFNMDAIPVPVVYSVDSDVEGDNIPVVVSKPKILRSNCFCDIESLRETNLVETVVNNYQMSYLVSQIGDKPLILVARAFFLQRILMLIN